MTEEYDSSKATSGSLLKALGRLLPDSKDLINLVEHEKPALASFAAYLEGRNARVVLSMVNVSELVAPLKQGRNFLEIRVMLQALERLPACYIREGYIIAQELLEARKAFERGERFSRPDPFVRRWDETIQAPGKSVAEMYVAYRLDEMIYTLWKGNALPDHRRSTEQLRRQFAAERSLPSSARKSLAANFPDALERHCSTHGISPPAAGFRALGEWVYSDPTRCPGFRLQYEMYHELQRNPKDAPKFGDIPDFAHIPAIPYVDSATVDRRIAHYLRAVCKRLGKLNVLADYSGRVFKDLEGIIATS